jgi:hypothetical protein
MNHWKVRFYLQNSMYQSKEKESRTLILNENILTININCLFLIYCSILVLPWSLHPQEWKRYAFHLPETRFLCYSGSHAVGMTWNKHRLLSTYLVFISASYFICSPHFHFSCYHQIPNYLQNNTELHHLCFPSQHMKTYNSDSFTYFMQTFVFLVWLHVVL